MTLWGLPPPCNLTFGSKWQINFILQSKVQNNINLHTKLQNNIKESLAQAQNGRLTLSCSTLKFWNFQCSFLWDFLAPSVPGSGHEAAGRWMRNARRRRIFFRSIRYF